MFDGRMTTYLHVREFVEATYGPLDDDSERQFLVMMGNALDQMWGDLRKSNYYLTSWEIERAETAPFYPPPEDLAAACSASGSVTVDEVTTTTRLEMHLAACPTACSDSTARNPGWKVLSMGATGMEPEDGYEPDIITITGYRRPSHQFFTYDDENHCYTWADIDLPPVFRNVFAKGVLGLVFFSGGDAPRGADWLSLANGEFASLRRSNPAVVDGTASQRGIYKMGSRSYLEPRGCCDLSEEWTIFIPVVPA